MKSFNENWDGIYRKAKQVEVNEAFIRQQQWATMRSNYKQGTPVNIVLKNGKTVSGTLLRMDKYDRGTADQGHMLHVKTTGGNTKVEDVDVKSIYWNNDPKTKISEEVEMEAYGNPFTPSVPGTFAAPNFRGGLKAGDKVKVPHKGKMVSGKIVRYDKGGTGQARQHGGGYIVDVGEPASILVPDHKVQKEEMTESSNLRTDLTNPKGKAVVDAKGKVIAVYRTERAARKHAETGKPVKEEMTESSHLRTDLTNPKGKAVVDAKGKVIAVYRTERAARKHAETGKPVKEEIELDEGLFNIRTEYNTFTKLDEFSKNMKVASIGMGKKETQMYIRQVANSLMIASNQQKEFFRGLIGMLEYLHMDVGNPSSKTDNVKIMNRLQIIISELKKYQK